MGYMPRTFHQTKTFDDVLLDGFKNISAAFLCKLSCA